MTYLDQVQALVNRQYGLVKGSWTRNRQLFGPHWEEEFDQLLTRTMPNEETLQRCLKGYTEFVVGSMRLHVQFIEDGGRYIDKPYEQASAEVYQNRDQMMNEYLPGILLSHFLWVHHYRQLLFFQKYFIETLARAGDRRFYDVGVGTGYMSVQILKHAPEAQGTGWDLSPHSLAYTRRLVNLFGAADRYTLREQNILTTPHIEPRPFVISVEVLEHLEDPVAFLHALRGLLRAGGTAFIATALNAPNADHIYLYRTAEDVKTQLLAAGFAVEQYFCALAGAPTHPDTPVAEVAAFIVK